MPNNRDSTIIDISFNLKEAQAQKDLDRVMKNLNKKAQDLTGNMGALQNVGISGGKALTTMGQSASGISTMFDKLTGSLTHNIVKMGEWAIAGTGLYGTLRKLKDMAGIVYEVDDAMRQVRGVTGMNESQTKVLVKQYQDMADELNTTTTALSDMSLELYRQGLTASETARRMEAITKIAGVENLDPSAVLQYVTASVNAYKEAGLTAEHYGDITVKAAAISATSVQEIATGLQRSSSIAQSAGLGFEKLVSWISTLSETTREAPSTIGNSVKSILARFSRVNEYGEDNTVTFGKVREAVKSVGVAFEDSAGQMRPVEDIMADLAKIFPTLNKNQQNYLATQIGGTFQINKILALFNNWNRTLEINNELMNAGGEYNRQYQEKVDSVRGKVDKLKNTFQDLALNTMNSQMLKSGLNFLNWLTEIVQKIGIARIAVAALALAFIHLSKSLQGMAIMGFITTVQKVAHTFGTATAATYAYSTSVTALSGAFKALGVALRTIWPLLVAMAIYELVASYQRMQEKLQAVNEAQDNFNNKLIEFNQTADPKKIDEMTLALEGMKQALEIEDAGKALDEVTEKLDKLIARRKDLEERARAGGGSETLFAELSGIQQRIQALEEEKAQIMGVTKAEEQLNDARAMAVTMDTNTAKAEMVVIAQKIRDTQATINLIDANAEEAAVNQQLMDQYPEFIKLINAKTGAVGLDTEALKTYLEQLIETHGQELEAKREAARAEVEKTENLIINTKIRIQAMQAELEAQKRLAKAFTITSESIKLPGQEKAPEFGFMAGSTASIEKKIGEETNLLNKQLAERERLNDEWSRLATISMDDLLASVPKAGSVVKETGKKAASGAKKASEAIVDVMEKYKQYIDVIEELDSKLNILSSKERLATGEDIVQAQEALISAHKEKQEALHEYAVALDQEIVAMKVQLMLGGQTEEQAKKLNDDLEKLTDTRRKLSETWWKEEEGIKGASDAIAKYREEQKQLAEEAAEKIGDDLLDVFDDLEKALERQKKIAEDNWDAQIKAAESELDAYRERNKILDEQIAREKILLELRKAQDRLNNILKEQNIRLLSGGQFQWVADPREVAKAQEDINKAQENLREHDVQAARNAEERRLQSRIDGLKAQKEAEMISYEERKTQLKDFEESLKNTIEEHQTVRLESLSVFLDTMALDEQDNFTLRIEQLNTFVTQWNEAIAKLESLPSKAGSGAGSGEGLSGNWAPDAGNVVTITNDGAATTYTEHFSGGGSYSESVSNKAVGGYVSAMDKLRVDEVGTEGFQWTENGKDYLMPLTGGKVLTANKMKSLFGNGGGDTITIGKISLPNVTNPQEFMREMLQFAKTRNRNNKPALG